MATKKRASKGSSSGKGEAQPATKTKRASTSRKTIRKTTAAYARRVEDDDDKEDKGGSGKKASAGKGTSEKGAARASAKDPAPDKTPAKDAAPDKASAKDASKSPAKSDPAGSADPPAKKPEPAAAPEPAKAPEPAEQSRPAASEPASPSMMVPAAEFAELLPPMLVSGRDPDAAAHPPGKAPPGDSRSFRRVGDAGAEFVLIYRHYSNLIVRAGAVGKEGTWTVTEYPNGASAATAYAHKCSELTGAGYRDLR